MADNKKPLGDRLRQGMFGDISGMQKQMEDDFQQLIKLLTEIRDELRTQRGAPR